MKHSLIFAFLFVTAILYAYKGDEKILKQATSFAGKKEFQKATDLFQKISDETKAQEKFLQLSSEVYDSLKDYKQAIASYELLLKETNSDGIVTRINFLRAEQALNDEAEKVRLEKMKNCQKCSGTGYFKVTETCDKCNGYKTIKKECQRCRGKGRVGCGSCQGAGKVYSEIMKAMIPCSKCNGQGSLECSNMCNRGTLEVSCTRCSDEGTVTRKVKCDLH